MDIIKVQASFERWISQDYVKPFSGRIWETIGEAGTECVLIVNIRIVYAMQHQVHGGDTQHCRVEVKAMKHMATDVFPILFEQIPGIDFLDIACLGIRFLDYRFEGGVGLQQILHDAH